MGSIFKPTVNNINTPFYPLNQLYTSIVTQAASKGTKGLEQQDHNVAGSSAPPAWESHPTDPTHAQFALKYGSLC